MSKYTVILPLQAQVPENQLLSEYIKYSIEFDIFCPENGCKNIKANGFDSKFAYPVQFYFCNVHRRTFYAHTSWLMKKFTEIIIQRILLKCFLGSISNVEIAERYNLSASTLSTMINHCDDFVDSIIDKINTKRKLYAHTQLPAILKEVIWIDETFFKVGKQSWALILAVDYNGRVLGWKFGRERKSVDIMDVLTQVGQYMPDWKVIIGDGAKPYTKAVRSFHKEAYLIQQFHSHPWEKARITKFEPNGEFLILENIIELDYQALLREPPQIGYAITKKIKVNVPKKKRGRKKGQKNGTGKKIKKKIKKLKRGPKTARISGRAFQFGHKLELMGIDWLQPPLIKNESPSKDIISQILWTTFMIFGNKSIVSNRVESVNAEFKNIIPSRGMHNENILENRIKRLIQLITMKSLNSDPNISIPVSARLGFNNLFQFVEPDIRNIENRKEVIVI